LGHEVVEVYAITAISRCKGRDKRPAFDRLCRDATRRRLTFIMAWSVDRLGRSLQDSRRLPERDSRPVAPSFICISRGFDTSTPSGRAMFSDDGVFAEFESADDR